jgi:hypothetical protein
MKQNFTVRQGALDGVEAFLSVAQQGNRTASHRESVVIAE